MKAGIYDPYLDTLGGGERYCLTVAEILLSRGWQVDLFWSGPPQLISQAQKRFSLNIDKLNLVNDIFQTSPQHIKPDFDPKQIKSLLSRSRHANQKLFRLYQNYRRTKEYDLFFYLSDGSCPFLFSRQNLLHIQVPFNFSLSFSQRLLNFLKIKLGKFKIICNSFFTQKFANQLFEQNCHVLYPPVDVEKFSPAPSKKPYILSVGRFDNLLNAKKQDILISAFQKLSPHHPSWKLLLVGGSAQKPKHNAFLKHLKYQAQNLPVVFIVNPDFNQLQKTYAQSQIYWHAAGFGVDQDTQPEKTEHFGITVVEAMASGLVPLAVNQGGLPEIVQHQQNGYCWSTVKELVAKTKMLITHPKKLQNLSQKAVTRAAVFSKQNFTNQFLKLINQP